MAMGDWDQEEWDALCQCQRQDECVDDDYRDYLLVQDTLGIALGPGAQIREKIMANWPGP